MGQGICSDRPRRRTGRGRKWEGLRRLHGLQAGDGVENFVMFGKAEGLELGKDQLAVHLNLKGAAAALDQGGYVVEFVFDRALQTCSIGQVVSFAAVFNRDVHAGPPQQKWMIGSSNKGGILVISPGSVKRLRRSPLAPIWPWAGGRRGCSGRKRRPQLP